MKIKSRLFIFFLLLVFVSAGLIFTAGAESGLVSVDCCDTDGKILKGYMEMIRQSRYIYPQEIDGYSCISDKVFVQLNGGECSPANIVFRYEKNQPAPSPVPKPSPVPVGRVVLPTSWDTQFKPETAISEYNVDRYKRLPNIGDDNAATTYEWLIVAMEREDDIPELTAYFRGNTVSTIGIRNGNLKNEEEYFYYSRATMITVMIYDSYGNVSSQLIEIPDEYSMDYWLFPLDRTYTDVSRIEFWLNDFHFDPDNVRAGKYLLYMADIQFYE